MDFNANEMIENMNAWTHEQIRPYLGKYVAWRLDGKAIIASAASGEEPLELLDRMGADPETYALDYLPEPRVELDPVTLQPRQQPSDPAATPHPVP